MYLSKIFSNSIVATVPNLWRHLYRNMANIVCHALQIFKWLYKLIFNDITNWNSLTETLNFLFFVFTETCIFGIFWESCFDVVMYHATEIQSFITRTITVSMVSPSSNSVLYRFHASPLAGLEWKIRLSKYWHGLYHDWYWSWLFIIGCIGKILHKYSIDTIYLTLTHISFPLQRTRLEDMTPLARHSASYNLCSCPRQMTTPFRKRIRLLYPVRRLIQKPGHIFQ